MTRQTVKCPICKKPYTFYTLMAGDQSACPQCVKNARNNKSWGPSAPIISKKSRIYNESTK